MQTKRLTSSDRELARELFVLMATVFEEGCEVLSDPYLDRLLSCEDFWAIAAFEGDDIIGGITAHTLPITQKEGLEIFVYDIAVRADRQRQGVGRRLITALRKAAAVEGIDDTFVLADNEDTHALDFYRALGGVESPVTAFTFSPGEGRSNNF